MRTPYPELEIEIKKFIKRGRGALVDADIMNNFEAKLFFESHGWTIKEFQDEVHNIDRINFLDADPYIQALEILLEEKVFDFIDDDIIKSMEAEGCSLDDIAKALTLVRSENMKLSITKYYSE